MVEVKIVTFCLDPIKATGTKHYTKHKAETEIARQLGQGWVIAASGSDQDYCFVLLQKQVSPFGPVKTS